MVFRFKKNKIQLAIILIIIIFLSITQPSTARATGILYVDADATGANDGSSWLNAYTNLESALAAAAPGDQIWVAEGTYYPGIERSATFDLKSGVAVYGGFTGGETALHQRDWTRHVTQLSGNIDPSGDNDSYHVVTGSGADATAILDGFTISAGRADGASPDDNGGGIYNASASPLIRNVIFKANTASLGGGMYNLNSSPTLIHVLFLDNSATEGGAMYNTNSSPIVMNATFSRNGVTKNGSAMANANSSYPTVLNSILWGNKSPSLHQIYNENSTTNVSYSDIHGPPEPGTGNLNTDPLFVNPANGDFRLQADSPAIDAGNNDDVPADTSDLDGDGNTSEKLPYDILGNLRFIDNPSTPDSGSGTNPLVDMGAFEYQYPNNAPVLDNSGNPSLDSIDEDDIENNGTLVSEILINESGGSIISDPDPDAQYGIAVVGANDTNGVWQYSTDGGTTWTDFGSAADTSAVLLTATPSDRLRFVPEPDFFGLLDLGINFRAWDGSDGWDSGRTEVDVSQNGGGSPYSSAIETAGININPVDDPPTISPISDLQTKINQPAGPVSFSIADIDTPLSGLSLSAGSSNPDLIPNGNVIFSGSGASRSVTLVPVLNAGGSATITLSVHDGTSSAETSFMLTVAGIDLYLPFILVTGN